MQAVAHLHRERERELKASYTSSLRPHTKAAQGGLEVQAVLKDVVKALS